MTMAEAATYAKVAKRTVLYAAKKGYLTHEKIAPNFWVTTQEAVDRWLRSEFKRPSRPRKL